MSEGAKTLRLSKVAKEFNLSLGKIVEFLASKGHQIESNPNAKIGDGEYGLLLKEFSSDKSAREEAENVAQNTTKLKRETILLSDVKAKKQKEEEDADEFMIKDLTLKSKIAPTEKIEVVKEAPKTVEPEIEKQETAAANDGPKVIGKLDLDSMNLRTKPDKKTKKEAEKKEVVEKPTVKEPIVESPTKINPEVISTEIPVAKEEPKSEFLETKYEKLEGPKILRSIELPVVKEVSKKPVNDPNADKKKRKRIRKGGLSQEEIKKVGKEQSAIAREKAKEKYGDPRAKKP